MAAGVRSPAGWSLEISSSRMNFRRSTSASTSPTASGVSRPFWSTAAARSTRYAPPWPCMRSQSVPISDRYQCRNGQKVTDWRAGARRSDGVVWQGLARPKVDEDREAERQGGRDDEARADTGGSEGDAGQELSLPGAHQLQQTEHHQLLSRSIACLLQPLAHDQDREGADRTRSCQAKDLEGARRISPRQPTWALPHHEQHRNRR